MVRRGIGNRSNKTLAATIAVMFGDGGDEIIKNGFNEEEERKDIE